MWESVAYDSFLYELPALLDVTVDVELHLLHITIIQQNT